MSTHFDDKGKIFTEFVTKEPVRVRIQTPTHCIQGNIHIRQGERIKDELNQAVQFIAVTDAVVFGLSGDEIFRTEFMIVNTDQVVWLTPEQDTPKSQNQAGATK
jgi:hypothetical protein